MVEFFAPALSQGVSGVRRGQTNPSVYQILISGRARGYEGSQNIDVLASIPEEFSLSISNEWEAMMSNGEIPIPGEGGGGFIGSFLTGAKHLARAHGVARSMQGFTSGVWGGTSPLEFELPLLFNAKKDATTDVVEPIKDLIRLASPYGVHLNATQNDLFDRVIHAPGPTPFDTLTNSQVNNISLYIGRFIHLPSVVITSIQADFPNRFTAEGQPVEANVNVGLKTHYTYLREDYESHIFSGRG